jgi:hypothetical protein
LELVKESVVTDVKIGGKIFPVTRNGNSVYISNVDVQIFNKLNTEAVVPELLATAIELCPSYRQIYQGTKLDNESQDEVYRVPGVKYQITKAGQMLNIKL